jgi:hypothetical protein
MKISRSFSREYNDAVAFWHLAIRQSPAGSEVQCDEAGALALAEAEILEANLASKQDLKDLETPPLGEKEMETGLRRDMEEMKTGLKRNTEGLETALRRDMKDLEYRMTIKLGSLMVIAVGSMATWVKLL